MLHYPQPEAPGKAHQHRDEQTELLIHQTVVFIGRFVSSLATGGTVVPHPAPLNNLLKVNVCMMDAGKPDGGIVRKWMRTGCNDIW